MSEAPKTLSDVKKSLEEAVVVVNDLLAKEQSAQPDQAAPAEQAQRLTETPPEAASEPTPPTE